jgi:multidrug efflux pump
MRSFTDTFIKHPVLAIVVNLLIVLIGWRAVTNLPVQQYPKIESSSVLITTVYTGASAETVRGFLTTPIERVTSAISGVDYIESTSRPGVSIVTVHLKLNHSSTAALAEITARLQQVRSELPAEAEPPIIEVQRADRPYASFYLSFTSKERSVPEITDWLARTMQPQLATLAGVQRVDVVGGRPIAMRVWIDPDKLAAKGLSPGDVYGALQRNNYLAAVGSTKGNLVQINLLANTDLRSTREFEDLIVADRDGAIVRLSDVARVELGAEEADMIAKYSEKEAVYLGVFPLPGSNEIEVAHRLHAELERLRPTLPGDIDMQVAYDATLFMEDALKEITKTLTETIAIVGLVVFLFMGSIRTALVPLVAMPVSLVGAAIVMLAAGFSLNLLTMLAIVLSVGLVVDDAIVVVENVERHVPRRTDAHPGRGHRRARARRANSRDDRHARRRVRTDRIPGRTDRHVVPRVRDHARRRRRRVGHRRGHALAGDELALRARARQGRPVDVVRQPRLRARAPRIRARARRRALDPLGDRRGRADRGGRGVAALLVLA